MSDEQTTRPTFSIVAPVRDQATEIPRFYERLAAEAEKLDESVEIIFVDDGSSDQTVASLYRLGEEDPRVRYVALSGRFGRPAAVTAGCRYATGEVVITLDRRCDDWPEVLARCLARWQDGFEVVHAGVDIPSRSTGWWVSLKRMWFGGHPRPTGAHMRLLIAPAVEAMRTDGGDAVTVDQQVEWIGFRQTSVPGGRRPGPAERAVTCDLPFELSASRSVLPVATVVLGLTLTIYAILLVLHWFGFDAGAESRVTMLVLALASFYIAAAALWRRSAGSGRASRERPAYVVRRAVGFDRPASPISPNSGQGQRGGYVVYT